MDSGMSYRIGRSSRMIASGEEREDCYARFNGGRFKSRLRRWLQPWFQLQGTGCMNATSKGPLKTEALGCFSEYHASDPLAKVPNFWAVIGKRSLQSSRIEPLNESLTDEEISDVLQNAEDPAKLVLDFIEVSYKKHPQREIVGFQNDVLKAHIICLKKLMMTSPPMTKQVKEGARKLVTEWKQRLEFANPENDMEVLRFLHLLAAYKLISLFSKAEILRLVEVVSSHDKADELCHALGFTKRITGSGASTFDPNANLHGRSERKCDSTKAPGVFQAQSNKRRCLLCRHESLHLKKPEYICFSTYSCELL